MNEHQISFEEYAAQEIPTPYNAMLDACPTMETQASFLKHYNKFREHNGHEPRFENVMVSVSGGADSDRMIDLIERIGYKNGTVSYHYYNTGMEYRTTIRHLDDLENKYGIKIERHYAKMPVAVACKRYGVPFLSKIISEYISRLQKHGFTWEDKPFDVLYAEYPKCKAALRWWCNEWGENSQLNINRRKWLKEFMVANPPDFQISDRCCQKAKKDTARQIANDINPDLNVQGVRKSEGGARATAYKSCFDDVWFGCSNLRPLFWWKKEDCIEYDSVFNIEHSDCYTKYGLCRTGCACCPFGKDWKKELEVAEKYEPGLYKVAVATFGKSYEYTQKYYAFRDAKDAALKGEREDV